MYIAFGQRSAYSVINPCQTAFCPLKITFIHLFLSSPSFPSITHLLFLSPLPFCTSRPSTPLLGLPPPSSCLLFSSPVFPDLGGQQDGGQGVDCVPSCHSDAGMGRGSESDQLHQVSCKIFRYIKNVFRYVCQLRGHQCPSCASVFLSTSCMCTCGMPISSRHQSRLTTV